MSSHGIAQALLCARARLPAHIPPRRPVDPPRPLPPDAQPCLPTCTPFARQTAPVPMLRARPQRAGHSQTHAWPAALDEPAAATSRVQRLGCRLHCAEKPRLPERTSHGQGSERSNAVLLLWAVGAHLHCSTHALQAHMHCSTHWADVMLLWICTQTCKSGAGMGTTLKWMLARARGQGDMPPEPCLYICLSICHKKSYQSVKLSPTINTFPTASPYGAQNRRMVGLLID